MSNYYIWASSTCDNMTSCPIEALEIYRALISEELEDVYIVDECENEVSIEMLSSLMDSHKLSKEILEVHNATPVLRSSFRNI